MTKTPLSNIVRIPLLITIILIGLFLVLINNLDKRNKFVNDDIYNGRAIVLSEDCNSKLLSEIVFNNGYADSKEDADFIARILVKRLEESGRFQSLYSLQKRAIGQVPAKIADSCKVLTKTLKASRDILGQNKRFSLYKNVNAGDGKIIVKVVQERKKHSRKAIPSQGDTIRLLTHYRDSLNNADTIVLGCKITDVNGVAVFDGLNTKLSYSVLPVMTGFEYGQSKGTKNGEWDIDSEVGGMEFTFTKKEHRIPLFGNATLRQIKNERTIMVRSPKEHKNAMIEWFVFVIVAWWLMVLLMLRKQNHQGIVIVSMAMLLTGLCVLMMFSMQDPLNDELHGITMAQGVLGGILTCYVFQKCDFIKLYQTKDGLDIPLNTMRWIFKPYKQKIEKLINILKSDDGVLKKMLVTILILILLPLKILDWLQITKLSKIIDKICDMLPKGIGWLLAALLITALLWTPLGESIGGMRVNLNMVGIRFQPSEIAKYFILLFMAIFYTRQAKSIIAYSQPYGINKIGAKIRTLSWMIIGLLGLMAMYGRLGDMGPALVLGITFILLYSLIKSKVNLEKLDDEQRWRNIFTCDFAMLIYGVISFAAFLVVGSIIGNTLVFGFLWFVFWYLFGKLAFKKQLFESALMLNAVIFVFVVAGNLGDIPMFKNSSVIERFEDRTSMCVNTWGNLDIENLGKHAEPVSNTQVANGLWSLASGGFYGQGMGNGKPSVTPAFHTDMILSSIGEQLGWLGLLMVVIALFVLLRRMAIVGFNVGHPFAFYLCLGFAIVIGVQFFIIALGSTGVIPLTGVTVPFLSYGRVSMILNLAALGIVLSLSNNANDNKNIAEEYVQRTSVEQYSYPIAMVTLVFMVFSISTLLVWQYYQVWKRNSTLIHPAYVINTQGAPSIEYNPRIALLTQNMYAGRVFDRNNVLLATSDRSEIDAKSYVKYGLDEKTIERMTKRSLKRYYPFGEHLFFMIGDINSSLLFSYDENNPVGYMAEAQHLSYLRGFDNVWYDKNGNPIKLELKTNRLRENTFLTPKDTVSNPILLRNYKSLLPYLKDGIDGKKVEKHNKKVKEEKYDLHLTIDAVLQTDLQNRITTYVKDNYNNDKYNLLRVSVVVLDVNNGDMLASANYPLPNYDTLRRYSSDKYYTDNCRSKKWKAYTDRDLGTSYQTAPGSTAKVMSAMAGFRNLGTQASSVTYRITNDNAIERSKTTGNPIEPTINNPDNRYRRNPVTMKDAIVLSSNCYFVSLVNDKDLYKELTPIYSNIGISIGGITPYYYSIKEDTLWRQKYIAKISNNREVALKKYDMFRQGSLLNPKPDADKKRRIKPMDQTNMSVPEWKWAWGQGYSSDETGESFDIAASPLNMARVAATIANNGNMPITQYVKGENKYEKGLRNVGTIPLISSKEANILKSYMMAEAANQNARNGVILPSFVGGKTGTPERSRVERYVQKYDKKRNKYVKKSILEDNGKTNDGWYMFFVEGDDTHHTIAVAVRMERRVGSGAAVRLTKKVILESLGKNGYIKN